MSLLVATPADAERRRRLRTMRGVALGLLLLAAAIFLATLGVAETTTWGGYVNTAAEAAMVGALADWFAVTALFKHPLGLPIPHTAIIPKRKNELGRNLQEFVTENFLTAENARDRLAAAHIGERLGRWLQVPANRQRVMQEVVRVSRAGLGRLSDDEVRELVEDFLLPRLVEEPIAPIAGSLLEGVVAQGTHVGLVDLTLEHFQAWLKDNPGTYAAVIGERAPWWSPPWVDDKVITWSYGQVLTWIDDIRAEPGHPARAAFDNLLVRLAADLQHDPEVMAKAEELKVRLLTHPQVPTTAVGLWHSFKAVLLKSMDDPSSYFHRRGDELLLDFGNHLVDDPVWRGRLEDRMAEAVTFFINTYGTEVAEVISVTVERWDAKEASQRIELFVGRDLQFIRINGTIVGALAGLLIHAVAQLIHG